LAVQADHAKYFEAIGELLREHPKLEESGFDDPNSDTGVGSLTSDFGLSYLHEGRETYRIAVIRRRSARSGQTGLTRLVRARFGARAARISAAK